GGGRPGAGRLYPRRQDDQLRAADGDAGGGQPRRFCKGVARRRGNGTAVTRRAGLPLAVSLAGHACLLVLLLVFLGRVPLPKPPQEIVVTLAPPPVPAPTIPALPPAVPPAAVQQPPPVPPPAPHPVPPRPQGRSVVRFPP